MNQPVSPENQAFRQGLRQAMIARRQALSAQLDLIGLQRDRVTCWIALYKAIGGGWDGSSASDITPPRSRASEQAVR